MICVFGACDKEAVVRAWLTRPCCGHVESVIPICMGHPTISEVRTRCSGCAKHSYIRMTKRKRIRTNHEKGTQ